MACRGPAFDPLESALQRRLAPVVNPSAAQRWAISAGRVSLWALRISWLNVTATVHWVGETLLRLRKTHTPGSPYPPASFGACRLEATATPARALVALASWSERNANCAEDALGLPTLLF